MSSERFCFGKLCAARCGVSDISWEGLEDRTGEGMEGKNKAYAIPNKSKACTA